MGVVGIKIQYSRSRESSKARQNDGGERMLRYKWGEAVRRTTCGTERYGGRGEGRARTGRGLYSSSLAAGGAAHVRIRTMSVDGCVRGQTTQSLFCRGKSTGEFDVEGLRGGIAVAHGRLQRRGLPDEGWIVTPRATAATSRDERGQR